MARLGERLDLARARGTATRKRRACMMINIEMKDFKR